MTYQKDISKIARLRALFEAAQEVSDGAEFLETLKVDLFSREIFVFFTPQGDVKIFPQGATALDFAYSIHTQKWVTIAPEQQLMENGPNATCLARR